MQEETMSLSNNLKFKIFSSFNFNLLRHRAFGSGWSSTYHLNARRKLGDRLQWLSFRRRNEFSTWKIITKYNFAKIFTCDQKSFSYVGWLINKLSKSLPGILTLSSVNPLILNCSAKAMKEVRSWLAILTSPL